jgi:DNA-binding NtrC family response regulator
MRGAVSDTETKVTGISREALKLLMAYDWPGNIRQLENAVFRAVVLAEGPVLTPDEFPQIRAQVDGIDPTDHLPAASVEFTDTQASESGKTQQAATAVAEDGAGAGTADEDIPAGWLKAFDDRGNIRTLEDMENDIIRFAIEFYDGQMSEVARRLGIGRSTLYRKLREYDIEFDSSSRDKLAS